MQPYTYLIGWSSKNVWYYGAQYGKKAHPSNLWKNYFTSSKYVKSFRTLYGEPDVVEVRKVFNDVKEAKRWETEVLIRLEVVEKDNWLNKTISNGYPLRKNNQYQHSEETKQKISESRKYPRCKLILPYKHSEETKQKIRQANTGKTKGPCTEQRKEKLREWKKDLRYNYNKTIYEFIHDDDTTFEGTMIEFCENYNLDKSNVCNLINRKNKSVHGWRIKF